MLKLLGAPVAGAAALLVCALALGIDPLVSAIIGALVWAGVQLLWGPQPVEGRTGRGPSPGQVRQLQAAAAQIARLDALSAEIEAEPVARRLDALAGRAGSMVGRLQADPSLFAVYRKALGTYLDQAVTLARRVREAEAAGRADGALLARIGGILGRLEDLFAAIDDRGAAMDRIDLDARIAVLEAEIDADLAGAPSGAVRTERPD